MIRESEIQRSILEWLKVNRYFAFRFPNGGVLQHRGGTLAFKKNPLAGFPDIFGIMKGRKGKMFCIEVKNETGRLTLKQKAFRAALEENGVLYILARSIADVKAGLTNDS